jgi:hypothetical protein
LQPLLAGSTYSKPRRPCRLKAKPLKDAVAWLEGYRRNWEQTFGWLDEYLNELQSKEKA